MSIVISNALPVKMWLAECATFNEEEVCGITPACWEAPWNCDDPIVFQFTDDEGNASPEPNYSLWIVNSDGELIHSEEFDKTDLLNSEDEYVKSLYSLSIIPSNISDMCNKKVQFLFVNEGLSETLFESDFASNLGGWTNEESGVSWAQDAVGGGSAVVVLTPSATTSKELTKAISQDAGTYQLQMDVLFLNFDSTLTDITFTVKLYNGATLVDTILTDTKNVNIDTNQQIQYDIVFEAASAFTEVVVEAERSVTLTSEVTLAVSYVYLYSMESSLVAKSDGQHIKTSHECTKLIEYSNNRNFAGLIYSDQSPGVIFYLRVPCVFFHPRFPQEDKAIERTSSTTVTSSKRKKQKLLQIEHAPGYFHEKLIDVLRHHTVIIDNKTWKKEEAYEIDDGTITYPLKKATVYLTEKNSLSRNVS